ncbi:Asp23/Gls24 family envelope stress response protein [Hominifimenecus microfluidus]|uniref:Asp23/Gls24 family envelope stress response protein n=1 Tax=Hominifimenecus microfluidus TaxID=2885348 RepID=A0AAE3JH73_9FIRM|nr:Asp23/Gls24 family envelope stress response protein [Hominifimenecus microfluidus]MCC2231551.1 Asp23/Gls24 family envelope stress response protein [Hominifimenecus microfluidus]
MAAEQTENKAAHVIHEKEEIGKVIISDEVFSLIAGLAAMEVEGVNSMAGNITRELVAKLAMKNLAKGVKVEVQDESVTVYMSLNIDFGYNIPQVSAKVQERVKASVENMTGFHVETVNIKIAGVIVNRDRA